ncbi:MAG: NrdH-redoxin [Candidatus Terrybacteria bacterium RIFCSPHIGHO2_01_FULL_48_17]|uniref:NrdH-redoxin n=1 Tax=Candidatus Terrybacteria bacterium RIFCSPHIGHO2_01_FULL_48_17 TaxID=1802362 RepID=A0A1G2PKJ2_9BACT|nr:MAG: NrdH-redoxin [Candidatus Terrybacteria bacterium RIFCSPHIGHO2_01_FULL_48_17]OHA53849.1 MAG: NrdH-redoxin [Candidatus Terrybacteria bacterium RIFCSPLOWO2_01_FULL_48_14]
MKVTLYTTPTCVYCRLAKQFFQDHNVEYTEYDVTRNEAARDDLIEKSGQLGVPVIDIDGNIVIGFNKEKLVQLLNISSH